MADKVIVTNASALAAKYKPAGVAAIKKSLKTLIAADKKRGIGTVIVNLDDAAAMKKLGAKPVKKARDPRENKTAIDGVYKALKPDYLMILGSFDVVPHQDLTNPTFSAGEDDDAKAFGDLPYACDEPYNRDPAKFVGPTRVVGRLPDLTGAKDPKYLLGLLKIAAGATSRPASDYAAYFGLSALVWEGSTRLSLEEVFGNASKLQLSPPKGPKHPAALLGTRAHFINCHGAKAAPEFYGQKGNAFPVSLTTKTAAGAIREGTVAAVECCFGGELYDSVTLGLDMPICQSYLQQGAYGYLGSTTIAYGPEDDNGAADYICQFFLQGVTAGHSIGHAALAARQRFVGAAGQMDPIDLKTLAQFCLYGDPSIHPVIKAHAVKVAAQAEDDVSERFRRKERRAKMTQLGHYLRDNKPTASKAFAGARPSANAKKALANIAAQGGLRRSQAFTAYKVKGVKETKGTAAKLASAPSKYYLTIGVPAKPGNPMLNRVAIIAKEVGGRIVDYRVYKRR
jgi:Peptidase family C25